MRFILILKSRGIAKPDLCIHLCFWSRRKSMDFRAPGMGGRHTPSRSCAGVGTQARSPWQMASLSAAPAAPIPSASVCRAAAQEGAQGSMGCRGYGRGQGNALKEITDQERRCFLLLTPQRFSGFRPVPGSSEKEPDPVRRPTPTLQT